MSLTSDAIKRATGVMRDVLKQVKSDFGQPQRQQPVRLSPIQQLDHFTRLSDHDFQILRQRYGDQGVENYIEAMRKLAGQFQ